MMIYPGLVFGWCSKKMHDPVGPHVVVFTTLFPHPGRPQAGLFIRERMFRVGRLLPLIVVSPQPWFPLQNIIRRFRPHFRPSAPFFEKQQGYEVYHPLFLSVPGLLKGGDGLFMAIACRSLLKKLKSEGRCDIIDAHFAYPDGYAASLLGKWLQLPVTITLRGTEVRHAVDAKLRPKLVKALLSAKRIFAVSDSLKRIAVDLGVGSDKVRVVGNGVDLSKFSPIPKDHARRTLGLPLDAKVMITVGGLCERKGFHRVIECMPRLLEQYPSLHYLVVGGATAEGDWSTRLKQQAAGLRLTERVHFLGEITPDKLKNPLSAADVFVLATRNEGWANVLLEAMACGLPVVATDVGGNAEVVKDVCLGSIVPFGDQKALTEEVAEALRKEWDNSYIVDYAQRNSWDDRVRILVEEFRRLVPTEKIS